MIEAAVVAAALVLDMAFGDPPSRYHPTAWMGNMFARLVPLARNRSARLERAGGTIMLAVMVCVVAIPAYFVHLGIGMLWLGWPASLLGLAAGAVLLKCTIAIRGMASHAMAVADSVDSGQISTARAGLSMIAKRSTSGLDRRHVISGVLESVSENTVDGITGPLFYFSFFGLPGAFAYRMVSTADSMAGYRTRIFRDVGWFAAMSDTVLNYLPARLTALVMILASGMLGHDWRAAYRIMASHAGNTASRNAGYPMATLAGALGVTLEKQQHYTLGDGDMELDTGHIRSAISIMKLTSVLFACIVVVPVAIALLGFGWWPHA